MSDDRDNVEELARVLAKMLRSAGMNVIMGEGSLKVKINNRWYRVSAEPTEVFEGDD
jgi:chromosome condensin MukBEF MukE localization factor